MGRNSPPKTELLQGTLDLLVLRVLQPGPQHGWPIAQRIHVLSQEALRIEEGSLYPALHRMEHKGWIEAEWGPSENNRRAKFYQITAAGRRQVEAEQECWFRLTEAMAQVLNSGS